METTKEKAKQEFHDNVVNHLQDLLEKNYDAEAGYKKAMELSKSDHLTNFLKRRAAQRSEFATQLDKEIRDLNETPKEKGTTQGALHRSWMSLKESVSGNSDEAVLEECIRGEKSSVEEYQKTLEKQGFTPHLQQVISNQKQSIESMRNEVQRLEDLEG